MFLQFYNLREQPFGVTPDSEYLYLSRTHRKALTSLEYGIESGIGFSALIAPPGMGKTTLLVALLERFENSARTSVQFETQCTSLELLQSLVEDFGIDGKEERETAGNDARLLTRIHRFLLDNAHAGRPVLVVVDEAQNLEIPVFETLRLLSNFETTKAKLLHIVLAGQPQLTQKLARPELEQLRQRVTISCKLDAFTAAETMEYVAHRLRRAGYPGRALFTPEALATLAASGRGIPREINRLCFNALSVGFTLRKRVIDSEVMEQVISELQDVLKTVDSSPGKQDSNSRLSGTPPEDLALLFARAMAAPAEARLQARPAADAASSDAAGHGTIAAGQNADGTSQGLAAEPSTITDWNAPGPRAPDGGLAWAYPKQSRTRAALSRYGLMAVVAAALGAGVVWSDRISSSLAGFQARAIRDAEHDRALLTPNGGLTVHASSSPPAGSDKLFSASAPSSEAPFEGLELDGEKDDVINENRAAGNRASLLKSLGARAFDFRHSAKAARTIKQEDAAPQTQLQANSAYGAGQQQPTTSSSPALNLPAPALSGPPTPAAVNGAAEASKPMASANTGRNDFTNHGEGTGGSAENTIVARRLLKRVRPVYPETARKRGISGGVVLSAHIGTGGTVEDVHAVSGNPLLAQAAIDAVRQWVYSPLLKNGEPQPSDETIVVGFSLR